MFIYVIKKKLRLFSRRNIQLLASKTRMYTGHKYECTEYGFLQDLYSTQNSENVRNSKFEFRKSNKLFLLRVSNEDLTYYATSTLLTTNLERPSDSEVALEPNPLMQFRRAFRIATNIFAAHRQYSHRKSSSSLHSTSMEKNQMADQILWVDTDCGYDDLCAISLLQGHSVNPVSHMRIEYFSTVNGMTNPVIGAKVIKRFLEINNLSASVACGSDSLSSQAHSITDVGWGVEYRSSFLSFMADQHLLPNVDIDASTVGEVQTIDCMVKKIVDHRDSNKITLLCLGPLTNIAFIMQKYPSFFGDRIERLVLMGGAVLVNGNAPGGAEYNFYLDPEAASFVFRNCPVPIEMFGLEVANDKALTTDQYEQIVKPLITDENTEPSGSNALSRFIRSLIQGNKDAISYDSIASYYLICPDAFTLQRMDIEVDNLTGQTKIVSKDNINDKTLQSTSINVATSMNKSSYLNYLLTMLRE